MKPNKVLGAEIIKVVENQIRSNNPPETKQNFDKLLKLGISDTEAKAAKRNTNSLVYIYNRTAIT